MKFLVYSSLFGAISFIATVFLHIPIAFGYIHLGDIILFLLLITFRKKMIIPFFSYIFFMSISDIYLGFPNYAITTFITRSIIVIIYSYHSQKNERPWIIIRMLSWLLIPLNYFFTDLLVFNFSSAVFFLLFNILQILIPLLIEGNVLLGDIINVKARLGSIKSEYAF